MTRVPRKALAVSALAAAAFGSYFALSTPGHSSAAPTPTRSYSLFQRPTTSADTLPADSVLPRSGARQIYTGDNAIHQWATVNGDQLCVEVRGLPTNYRAGPTACNSLSTLARADQLLVLGVSVADGPKRLPETPQPPPPPTALAGVVPDGISAVTVTYADGSQDAAGVSNNGFHVSTHGRMPSSFAWQTADGTTHRQS